MIKLKKKKKRTQRKIETQIIQKKESKKDTLKQKTGKERK